MLAIVFALEYLNQYTFGWHEYIKRDHKPLEMILQKPLTRAPQCLQLMMMLQKYNVTMHYKHSKNMHLADMLSRVYLPLQRQRSRQHWISQNGPLSAHIWPATIQNKSRDPEEPVSARVVRGYSHRMMSRVGEFELILMKWARTTNCSTTYKKLPKGKKREEEEAEAKVRGKRGREDCFLLVSLNQTSYPVTVNIFHCKLRTLNAYFRISLTYTCFETCNLFIFFLKLQEIMVMACIYHKSSTTH